MRAHVASAKRSCCDFDLKVAALNVHHLMAWTATLHIAASSSHLARTAADFSGADLLRVKSLVPKDLEGQCSHSTSLNQSNLGVNPKSVSEEPLPAGMQKLPPMPINGFIVKVQVRPANCVNVYSPSASKLSRVSTASTHWYLLTSREYCCIVAQDWYLLPSREYVGTVACMSQQLSNGGVAPHHVHPSLPHSVLRTMALTCAIELEMKDVTL